MKIMNTAYQVSRQRPTAAMTGVAPSWGRLLILFRRLVRRNLLGLRLLRLFLRLDAPEEKPLRRVVRQYPLAAAAEQHALQLQYLVLQGDHHLLQFPHVRG